MTRTTAMLIAGIACVLPWSGGLCQVNVQPLSVSVQLDRQAYTIGEPITLTVTLTNTSGATTEVPNFQVLRLGFLLGVSDWWSKPQVLGEDGRLLEYTGGLGNVVTPPWRELVTELPPNAVSSSSCTISSMFTFREGHFAVSIGDWQRPMPPRGSTFNPLLLSNTAFFRVFATAEERDKAVKAGLPELAVEITLGERKVVSSQAPVNTLKGVFAPLMEACDLLQAKTATRGKSITITRADRKLTLDTTTGKFTLLALSGAEGRAGRKTTKGETDLVTAGDKLMLCFSWLADSLGVKDAKLSWRVVEKKR